LALLERDCAGRRRGNSVSGRHVPGFTTRRIDMAVKGAGGNAGAVTAKGGDGAGGSTGTGRGGGNNGRGTKSTAKGKSPDKTGDDDKSGGD
jgi:hypothetical protein